MKRRTVDLHFYKYDLNFGKFFLLPTIIASYIFCFLFFYVAPYEHYMSWYIIVSSFVKLCIMSAYLGFNLFDNEYECLSFWIKTTDKDFFFKIKKEIVSWWTARICLCTTLILTIFFDSLPFLMMLLPRTEFYIFRERISLWDLRYEGGIFASIIALLSMAYSIWALVKVLKVERINLFRKYRKGLIDKLKEEERWRKFREEYGSDSWSFTVDEYKHTIIVSRSKKFIEMPTCRVDYKDIRNYELTPFNQYHYEERFSFHTYTDPSDVATRAAVGGMIDGWFGAAVGAATTKERSVLTTYNVPVPNLKYKFYLKVKGRRRPLGPYICNGNDGKKLIKILWKIVNDNTREEEKRILEAKRASQAKRDRELNGNPE